MKQLLLIVLLVACTQPPIDIEPDTRLSECPPLPTLSKDATRFEHSLWTQTVIALYEQCANSKARK